MLSVVVAGLGVEPEEFEPVSAVEAVEVFSVEESDPVAFESEEADPVLVESVDGVAAPDPEEASLLASPEELAAGVDAESVVDVPLEAVVSFVAESPEEAVLSVVAV